MKEKTFVIGFTTIFWLIFLIIGIKLQNDVGWVWQVFFFMYSPALAVILFICMKSEWKEEKQSSESISQE